MRSGPPDRLRRSCTARRTPFLTLRAGIQAVVHGMHTPDDDVLIPFFITEHLIPRHA
jgi:hypothetical protein